MSVDYSRDYLHWSQTEQVSVTIKRAGSADVVVADVTALRADTALVAKNFGVLELSADEEAWWVPAEELGDHELRERDEIADEDAVGWIVSPGRIRLVRSGSSKSHYECLAVKKVE